MSNRTFAIGSRGSKLAVAQRREAIQSLLQQSPDTAIREVDVASAGDLRPHEAIREIGTSVFVSELQASLLAGEIDIAVHSLKDLPTSQPDGLTIAAVPYREDPRDAVVSAAGVGLDALERGSVVGTGSPRRAALMFLRRPDLVLHVMRGNVTTRLEHLDAGNTGLDALIIAAAGLKRLGMAARVTEYLGCMDFVAAPAQGALALECRTDDTEAIALCARIEHETTRRCVETERAFVRNLGAGCSTAIGAHARIDAEVVTLSAFVSDPAASRSLRARESAPAAEAVDLARRIARSMLADGAADLLASGATAHTDAIADVSAASTASVSGSG